MENQGKINDLFMVDDVTGEVFLRQSLLDENEERFEVWILQIPILFNVHARTSMKFTDIHMLYL